MEETTPTTTTAPAQDETVHIQGQQSPTNEQQTPAAEAPAQEPAAADSTPSPEGEEQKPAEAQNDGAPSPEAILAEKLNQPESVPQKKKPQMKKAPQNTDDDRKELVARRRQEHKDMLVEAGYSPAAVLAILRYMNLHNGYETTKSKDHLILMASSLARDLKYRLPKFTSNDAANMFVAIIDILSAITTNPPREAAGRLTMTRNAIHKAFGGEDNPETKGIQRSLIFAINIKVVEGYLERARYLFEMITDLSMKAIDPFENLFHEEELEVPESIKHLVKRQEVKLCPECGKPMIHIFKTGKDFCLNPDCKNYAPPPQKKFGRHPFRKGPRGPKPNEDATVASASPKGGEFRNDVFENL